MMVTQAVALYHNMIQHVRFEMYNTNRHVTLQQASAMVDANMRVS